MGTAAIAAPPQNLYDGVILMMTSHEQVLESKRGEMEALQGEYAARKPPTIHEVLTNADVIGISHKC